jgi:hypothetical protein
VATKTGRAVLRTDAAKTQGSRRKVQGYEVLRGSMHAKPWPMAEAGTMVQFASCEACCATQATVRSTMGFVRDVERSGAEVPAPVPRAHMDRCNCRPNAGTTFFQTGTPTSTLFYVQDVVPRFNSWASRRAMIVVVKSFLLLRYHPQSSSWLPGHPGHPSL